MLGWLLVAVLGIIWAAFLIPSWRRSPSSTVEQFEERMNLLAEANRASPGRWVLVPKKGQRFLGPHDRQRARLRRRRRYVFIALIELTALTLIMGMFQPLRAILLVSAFLGGVLVVYVGLLLRFRVVEMAQADRTRKPVVGIRQAAMATGGNGYQPHPNGNGNGSGKALYDEGSVPAATNGNGSHSVVDEGYLPAARYLRDGGVQIVDEDVHVVVRRSDEVDLQALRAANGASAE
jgi:hypothetical protein